MFARRRLGPGRAPRRADPRPPRDQAALLRARRRRRRVRLRAEVRPRQRPGERRARPRGDRRLPHARIRAGPADAAARRCGSSSRASGSSSRTAASRVERWWRYPAPDAGPGAALRRTNGPSMLLDKLEESVRMRLMSDVPLGAMLSGGLDSSLIVALMARHMDRAGQDLRGRLRGRGLGAPRRARVAACCGADHHELEVDAASDPRRARASSSGTSTSRSPTSPRSASSPLCELAAEHVTVALSGQGADELLGGYRKHRVASLAEHWGRVPGPLRAAAGGGAAPRPGPRRPAGRRAPGAPTRRRACSRSSGLVHPDLRGDLFGGALAEHAGRGRGACVRGQPGRRARRRAARGRALPGRAARPGRRHAHLLRPRVDGLLARGPGAVPRSRARGALRAHPGRAQGAPACQGKHVLRLAARGPRARLRARQAQARLLQRGGGRLARRRRRRRGRRSCCSRPHPAYAAGAGPRRGRAGRARVARRRARATRTCCSR